MSARRYVRTLRVLSPQPSTIRSMAAFYHVPSGDMLCRIDAMSSLNLKNNMRHFLPLK